MRASSPSKAKGTSCLVDASDCAGLTRASHRRQPASPAVAYHATASLSRAMPSSKKGPAAFAPEGEASVSAAIRDDGGPSDVAYQSLVERLMLNDTNLADTPLYLDNSELTTLLAEATTTLDENREFDALVKVQQLQRLLLERVNTRIGLMQKGLVAFRGRGWGQVGESSEEESQERSQPTTSEESSSSASTAKLLGRFRG